jgi:predicted ATPase/serine phosphatase RsbU (regulator of sigma subunit)/tRNA A-37 threonylcarbamoyl transferase component Bud32
MVTIAGYHVLSTLYQGSRSRVYRGQADQHHPPIILKVMQAEYPSLEELGRYRLEYEILNRLSGQGVATAYELIQHQNGLVLVLEDFGGESLQRLLHHQRFDLGEFLQVAIALADSLGHVHAANVIHKDISPANIVLNPVTQQVKLIDFGNATILSRESPTIGSPSVLEGTLPYLSPEQTGRMNRVLDYRTDFYSLGATFYELLTGLPPFSVTDAMELIHCHLAKQPEPPHQINPDIPGMVSQVVLKLLAKNAEDRYQSAYGLKADLQRCLEQWQQHRAIAPFALGQQDASGKFYIPQKLYGRSAEVETLLTGFERVVRGASEVMLVAGYSGIGKSALVHEIHKPITRRKGYFIAGKYDQFQRNSPYSGLIQAFQDLMRQLLTESPEQIERWRLRLAKAVGSNGQVVIDVIPEVELILGKQVAPPQLGPREAQNRFNLVFQTFIRVFTQADHPLVIFLDDMQWADSASLRFIHLLMTAPDSRFLFLVQAYRNNEVNPVHPLMTAIADLRLANVAVSQIELAPLDLATLTQLAIETFHSQPDEATPLADRVLQVTGGNPLFINEFLKSLYDEGLLNFDAQQGCWQWRLEEIQAAQVPDNVVQLMTGKLQKLPPRTQHALKLAACVGNQFDLRTLAIISEAPAATVAQDLLPGVQEGLILPLGERYKFAQVEQAAAEAQGVRFKFLHDRVQQVAYSLIPDADKKAIHRAIGQLLLSHTPADQRADKIFDIVNQLNVGIGLTTQPTQRDELAALNQMAGQKAKDSAAYDTALRYLLTGIDLLGENNWQRQYDLTLALHTNAAEAAYLNGDFAETERLVERILHHAKSVLDCVPAYRARINAYTAQNNLQAAIDTIVVALGRLGEKLPRHPNRLRVGLELLHTRFWSVGRRSLKQLEHLPPMTDPYKLAVVQLAGAGGLAATNTDPLLIAILALRVVNLVVQYGSSPMSTVQGIAYGVMLRVGLGDINGAYRFSQVSLNLLERLNDRYYKTLTLVAYESCIRHWKEPLRDSLPVLLKTYQEGLELGNQEFGCLSASVYCIHQLVLGEPLATVVASFEDYHTQLLRFNQVAIADHMRPWHQLALNLQGSATAPEHPVSDRPTLHQLAGSAFNESEMLPLLRQNQLGIPLFYAYIAKAIWLYHTGDYAGSWQASQLAKPLEESAPVTPGYALRYFYESLAALALCFSPSIHVRRPYLRRVSRNQRLAKGWAKSCPENYQHRYYLVEAERLRLRWRFADAIVLYDLAIESAKANQYLQEAALANELAARCLLSVGKEKLAQPYLLEARHSYLRWGANFKVEQLDALSPQLRDRNPDRSSLDFTPNTSSSSTTSSRSVGHALDLETVIQAAQAISGEIVLERLLEKLLQLALGNAGAQTGALLLARSGELHIEADGQVERDPAIQVQTRPLTPEQLPLSIINYVQRTREPVVLRDAVAEGLFMADPYVLRVQPRSILCSPILNQGNLSGIVYLENTLATDTFTPERLTVLTVLSGQAAIALENASFYRTLEAKVDERTAQLAQANQEITLLNQRLQSENLRMSTELDVTRQLQQMILPKPAELNQIPGLDIAGFMEPAEEVGGDYYDVLHDQGRIKIGIGDVTGHGLESGVLMLMVQTAVRTLLLNQETDAARFLNTVNRVIYENVQRMNADRSLTLALLDYEAGRLRLTGQHEELLVVRAGGAIERIKTTDLGFPIGLIDDIQNFVAHWEVDLQPGDGIVLYTDGITEAANPAEQLYGLDRLCQVISQHWHQPAAQIREAIITDVRHHIADQKIFDDITLLVMKQQGED